MVANFSEHGQRIQTNDLRLYGLTYRFTDLISDRPIVLHDEHIYLEPYQVLWLRAEDGM